MPYLTSLLIPISAVVTGLPPTLSNVGTQLDRSNTLLAATSAATLSAGAATSTFLPTICARVFPIPEKLDTVNTNLGDLKTTSSSINSNISFGNLETTAIKNYLSGALNNAVETIRANSFVGTNSNAPLFVNPGALTYLVDSVSIDGGIKRLSSTSLTNSLIVNLSANRVFNVCGVSTATIDQYIQLYDITGSTPTGTPAAVFLIPANSNFSFDFNRGLPFTNSKLLVVNSLTPISYNPGNSDLFITVIYN